MRVARGDTDGQRRLLREAVGDTRSTRLHRTAEGLAEQMTRAEVAEVAAQIRAAIAVATATTRDGESQ